MKKLIGVLVVIALIVGYFAYQALFSAGPKPTDIINEPLPATESAESAPSAGVGTLGELSKRGENLECQITYDSTDYEGVVEGTFFVNDGLFRGDFIIPTQELGGQIVSSIITTKTESYVWSEINGATYGFKTNFTEASTGTMGDREPIPTDAKVRYVCSKWINLDRSIFVPPAQVNFQNLDTLMEGGMEYGTQ